MRFIAMVKGHHLEHIQLRVQGKQGKGLWIRQARQISQFDGVSVKTYACKSQFTNPYNVAI